MFNLVTGKNVIAVKASDTHGGCRHMCVDAFIHFAATTPGWLIAEPKTGTIPAQASAMIQITFNASGLNPGLYLATLDVVSGDPSYPTLTIPVTMTVTAQYQDRHLPMILNNEPP